MECRICEKRRPRRYCPGVRGDICSQCCGTEREMTVDCPLDCEYLREARQHEKLPEVDPDKFPNQDVRVTESFLEEHSQLLEALARSLVAAAFQVPGAIDLDAREALQALIRTYRTLQSGLVYETRPNNLLAGMIQQGVQVGVEEYRRQMRERSGITSVRDTEVLGILVFLERLELQYNNGRRRGRAYLDFLSGHFAGDERSGSPSSLIIS